MKLLFKPKIFSWTARYDIYDEAGMTVFTIRSKVSWGQYFKIFNSNDDCVAAIRLKIPTILPKFEIYYGDRKAYAGCINREFDLLAPRFNVDFNGWHVDGDFFGLDFDVIDSSGTRIATVSRDAVNLPNTYVIDISNPQNQLGIVMVVIAIVMARGLRV